MSRIDFIFPDQAEVEDFFSEIPHFSLAKILDIVKTKKLGKVNRYKLVIDYDLDIISLNVKIESGVHSSYFEDEDYKLIYQALGHYDQFKTPVGPNDIIFKINNSGDIEVIEPIENEKNCLAYDKLRYGDEVFEVRI